VLAHRPKSLLHDPFEEAPEDFKIAAFPDAGRSFTGGPEVVMRTLCPAESVSRWAAISILRSSVNKSEEKGKRLPRAPATSIGLTY
jgi:hypothetical protein